MSVVVLNNVSWRTYECLLQDFESRSAPRFTYNEGILQIMSPLVPHEEINRTAARLVETVLEEWQIDYKNLGSVTIKNKRMDKGFEPDTCFYVNNIEMIRGKRRIVVAEGDPVPDLVIEMDLTNDSIDKLPIFAAFRVPEVWRIREQDATIYVLQGEKYEERDASAILPTLTRAALSELIVQSQQISRLFWVTRLRSWAQANVPQP